MPDLIKSAVVAVVVLIGAAVDGSPQHAPAATFRSGSDLLTLDVAVRDKNGQPITDIQSSDFLVTIDGQPRRVVAATLFGHDAARDPNAATPLPGFARGSDASPGRVVVFAVDRDSIQPGSEKAVLESTSAMLESLSPADTVGVFGLPVGGIDLTRDHRAAADAIRLMTGTKPRSSWQYKMSWEEAVAYELRDSITIARVVERECIGKGNPPCAPDLERQAHEMLLIGRG